MVGVRIKQCQQYSAHPSSPFVPLCHPLPNSNNALYSYSAGVYSPRVDATAYEDHAVTLVGYTDMWMNSTSSLPVWIIKNRHARWSWSGCTTGRGGYLGLPGASRRPRRWCCKCSHKLLHSSRAQRCPSSPCHPVPVQLGHLLGRERVPVHAADALGHHRSEKSVLGRHLQRLLRHCGLSGLGGTNYNSTSLHSFCMFCPINAL